MDNNIYPPPTPPNPSYCLDYLPAMDLLSKYNVEAITTQFSNNSNGDLSI